MPRRESLRDSSILPRRISVSKMFSAGGQVPTQTDAPASANAFEIANPNPASSATPATSARFPVRSIPSMRAVSRESPVVRKREVEAPDPSVHLHTGFAERPGDGGDVPVVFAEQRRDLLPAAEVFRREGARPQPRDRRRRRVRPADAFRQ